MAAKNRGERGLLSELTILDLSEGASGTRRAEALDCSTALSAKLSALARHRLEKEHLRHEVRAESLLNGGRTWRSNVYDSSERSSVILPKSLSRSGRPEYRS